MSEDESIVIARRRLSSTDSNLHDNVSLDDPDHIVLNFEQVQSSVNLIPIESEQSQDRNDLLSPSTVSITNLEDTSTEAILTHTIKLIGSSSKNANNTSIENNVSKLIALDLSSFRNIAGRVDSLITENIMSHLNVQDILNFSSSCKYFHQLTKHNTQLWTNIYIRDFLYESTIREVMYVFDEEEKHNNDVITENYLPSFVDVEQGITHHRIHNKLLHDSSFIKDYSKRLQLSYHCSEYIERFKQYQQKVKRNQTDRIQLEATIRRMAQAKRVEDILDLFQLRLFLPFLSSSIFLFVILLCQKADGLDIPYWSCFSPLAAIILYMIISFVVFYYIQQNNYSSHSIFHNMWFSMRGPLVTFYAEVIDESKRHAYFVYSIFTLMLLQIGLLVVKLSSYIPNSFREELHWGIVFIPIWLCFVIYCALPCLGFRIEAGLLLFGLVVIWIPFFILFVCLTVKLEDQYADRGNHHHSIRLAELFVPLYFIEGFIMIASAISLLIAYNRRRRGYVESVKSNLVFFALSWQFTAPLVIFQSLLSARDDQMMKRDNYNKNDNNHHFDHDPIKITATESATPLLILIGWLTLMATLFAIKQKSAFHEARLNANNSSAGLRIIHNF